MTTGPDVAIIADDVLQRYRLQQAVGKYGLPVAFIGEPQRFMSEPDGALPTLCIVELADEEDHPELLEMLLNRDDCTVLFGVGKAPEPGRQEYVRWERRLLDKLESRCGALEALDSQASIEALVEPPQVSEAAQLSPWIRPAEEGAPAREVWVLGASLGGPAAVKAFLDALPAGLPIAFVYAQHIDASFSDVLGRVLTRHAHYQLTQASEGEPLRCGQVLQVPIEQELWLDGDGLVRLGDNGWSGPYAPSIDQVMLNVARCYGGDCHAIVFSGMGNDGALAAPVLSGEGSQIWIQTPDSCASSAMPESVSATGCSRFQGEPRELAAQLIRTVEEHCLLSNDRCSSA